MNIIRTGLRLAMTFCLLSGVAMASSGQPHAQTIAIEFGVAPQHSAGDLSRRWTPVLQYLSRKTGYDLRFRTGKDVPTYQRQCIEGQYDMIYINPYHYANLIRPKSGYEAFAKEKDGKLVGVVVVRKDSAYRTLRDLHGKVVAFPGRTAIVATLMPLADFKASGTSVQEHYVSSHESAFHAVAKGLYDAGGGDMKTLTNMNPELRDQLRILWTGVPLPPLVFAAHPRVPEQAVRRVQEAMIAMDHDPAAVRLLQSLDFKGIVAARDSDYDAVRTLRLEVPQ